MRVLIADQNVRLLESISLAFIHQFSIHTASTRQRCADLLQQSEFDLVIVCEKLADGPGLQLLGQIARSSPDTLRIFAARRSRLQLLKGRLRPFGLFRTLSYPIDTRRLLSTLTLARAGLLQIDKPAPGITHVAVEERQADEVSATITSVRKIQPSELLRGPPLVGRQATRVSPGVRSAQDARPPSRRTPRQSARPSQVASVALVSQSAPSQPTVAPSATPPRLPSQSASFQRALARREAAKRATSEADSGWISPLAQSPPLGALPELATLSYPARNAKSADATPKRATVFLGGTLVAVFLVTTLTLRLFDGAARSSSALTTKVGAVSAHFSPIERPEPSAPSRNSTSAAPKPSAQPAVSKPIPARPDVAAPQSQMAADNTPIADPSTFGSEAAEPIYN
jgi:DNA-binding NarL/FixJ family response regulator